MRRIYYIDGEYDKYNQREDSEILEKAFKEGCEHGYKKAMRELESYSEKKTHYNEGFEEKIEKLKRKFS